MENSKLGKATPTGHNSHSATKSHLEEVSCQEVASEILERMQAS